jgi:hypothetical protein
LKENNIVEIENKNLTNEDEYYDEMSEIVKMEGIDILNFDLEIVNKIEKKMKKIKLR